MEEEMDEGGPTMAPCPDCRAPADARCADDCQRVRGQVGLTFNGSVVPVRWTQTEVCDG